MQARNSPGIRALARPRLCRNLHRDRRRRNRLLWKPGCAYRCSPIRSSGAVTSHAPASRSPCAKFTCRWSRRSKPASAAPRCGEFCCRSRRGRRHRLGRMRRRRRTLLCARNSRDRVAHPARFSLARAAGQGIRLGRRSLGNAGGHVRGHNMAKASLEAAIWDAEAKQKGLPLWKLIGGARAGDPLRRLHRHQGNRRRARAHGRARAGRRLPAHQDQDQARARRRAGRAPAPAFPGIHLMVDANSAYRLEDAPLLQQLDAYYLMMIEQPLGWDDIFSHVELQRKLQTPSASTSASTVRSTPAPPSPSAPAASSISSLAAWAATPRAPHSRPLPETPGTGLVRRDARIGHRPRPQYRPFDLAEFHPARRRDRQPPLLDRRHHRARSHDHPRRHDPVPQGPGIGYEPRIGRIEALTLRRELLE